jgi:predicted signal transduction protein with EAL and GGDEF domain
VDQASAFAWAVLEMLKSPVKLNERKIYISASIGIASGTPASCSSTELFRRADIAMYHSKKSGKGRTSWYDETLNDTRQYQLNIENGIRQGLENDEFDVWYQPIVNADTLVMEGVEALLRWPRRPEGPLPPDVFIGIAESSGLIYALGQFALYRACCDLQSIGELMLSVNISPAQFRDPEFETRVVQVLARCHFPARRLQIEVTESYVMENPARALAAIENLKALGARLRWMILALAIPASAICAVFASTRLKLINRWPGWWMWMPRPRNWFAGPCVSPERWE